MTTPQNPGDGETPQDPSDPQNPYSPTTPPTAPATPIPPPASPYGASSPPPYGTPTPTPYGEPAAPPPYQPGMSPMPMQPQPPGKGLGLAALILSILGCLCVTLVVAVPLAIVALVKGRGRGLAVASLVISAVYVVGFAVGGYLLYDWAKDLKDANQLEAGQCITADGLTDADAEGISLIREVDCSDEHDGEVLSTDVLTAETASNFSTTDPLTVCGPSLQSAGKLDLIAGDITLTALTVPDPEAGDHVACVAYRLDGASLTDKLG